MQLNPSICETCCLSPLGSVQALNPMDEVILPLIADEVEVSLSGQDSFANAEARQVPRESWRFLEMMLGITGDGSSSSLQDLASVRDKQSKEQCCVGEEIGVDVQLKNPLDIELVITKMHLVCSFDRGGCEVEAKFDSEGANSDNQINNANAFQVKEERITLHPKEEAMVHLRVLPLQIGKLTICGIAWLINGVVHCRKRMSWDSVRSPLLQQRWSSNELTHVEQEPVVVRIMPPMPRLMVSLDELPETFFAGQMSACRLRLHNMGAMSLQGIRVAVDSRSVFFDVQNKMETSIKRNAYTSLLPSIKLGVNEQLEIPVLIRQDFDFIGIIICVIILHTFLSLILAGPINLAHFNLIFASIMNP